VTEREVNEIGSYAALIRRRSIWIVSIFPTAVLLSVFLAFYLPAQYRSTATLMLEQAAIPDDFIKSTVRSYAGEQIDVIQGRVMTVDALKELVQQYDPYPDEKNMDAQAKALRVIENTSLEHVDPVTFKPKDEAAAVSLYYQNPNPRRASEVADRLADLFLTYHQKARIEAAREATKLVQDRSITLAKELAAVDDEYARLRAANGGTLPDDRTGNDDARYRAERDLTDLEKQLRTAQEQESLLTIQLSSTSPNLLLAQGSASSQGAPNGNGLGQNGLTDIATVKAELADAELRYTPDHPDVKRLKRALAALQAQQGTSKDSVPDNPEYRRLSGQLAAAKADVAALTTATARARVQLAKYEAKANPSPELSQKVDDLERRRASLQTEYQAVQEKLKSAQLGQVAESGKDAEHFTLLQSPYPTSEPYSPNRIGVILLGLVLGAALTGVAVAIAESSDPTVRGARDIIGLNDAPILANIPDILLASDLARKRMLWGSILAVYTVGVVLDVWAIEQAHVQSTRVESSLTTSAASQPK
jgi:uncharacterized protein involved in exopolysaccharide biosynthesis